MLTGPGEARVTEFGHTTIRARVTVPGRYLLRVHYNPYWRLSGPGCVRRGPAKMTVIALKAAGAFTISITTTADGLIDAVTAKHDGAC